MKFLLRISPDLTTKADKTRRRFLRMLIQNLRDAFASEGISASVEPGWVRIQVEADDARAGEVARRVFGIHSVSPVDELPWSDLDDLVRAATPYFLPHVHQRTFAVRARTAGATPYRSRDIEVALGAALAPHGTVRLVGPQSTCYVEVRDRRIFLYTDSRPAWRGLPIGSEGRAVSLLSGGFDSAVASWMMLRRGAALDYVFCRLGGPTHQYGALRVLQIVAERWSYGDRPRVWVVPFEDVVEKIRSSTRPALWQLVLKRLMYRTAEVVARTTGGEAIVTGESLGQVSSQTLKNLRALDGRLQLPLLRPLVGLDKEEIIARSRDIGTHDLSATVQEYCAIQPDKPATAASSRNLATDEALVDVDFAARIAKSLVLEARRLAPEDLAPPGLEIQHVPVDAVVFDLRGLQAYRTWHYPDALHLDLQEGLKLIAHMDSSKTYVAYCEFGLKSAHLAYRMREAGLDAYNFHGGLRALARYASTRAQVPLELLPDDLARP